MSEVKISDLEILKNDIIINIGLSDFDAAKKSTNEFNEILSSHIIKNDDIITQIRSLEYEILDTLGELKECDDVANELYKTYLREWNLEDDRKYVTFEMLINRLSGVSYKYKSAVDKDIKLAKDIIADELSFDNYDKCNEMYSQFYEAAGLVMADGYNGEYEINLRNSIHNDLDIWWSGLNKSIGGNTYYASDSNWQHSKNLDSDDIRTVTDVIQEDSSKQVCVTDMIYSYGYGSNTIKLQIICDDSIIDGVCEMVTTYDEEIESSINKYGENSKEFNDICSEIFMKMCSIKFHLSDIRLYLTTAYLSKYINITITPELHLLLYGSDMPVDDSNILKSSKEISANDVYDMLPDNAKMIWKKAQECMLNGDVNRGFNYIDKMLGKLYNSEYYESLRYALKRYIGSKSVELSVKLSSVYPNLSKVLE